MADQKKGFFAYPAAPTEIKQAIHAVEKSPHIKQSKILLELWESNDISGVPLVNPIFDKITNADFLAADITFLNENVAFEVGFAIGSYKRCLLFRNKTLEGDRNLAARVGIFDTLGYEEYENGDDLEKLIVARKGFDPIRFEAAVNHKAPMYVIEPLHRSDMITMLISRVKKARWMYRSFSPGEDVA